MNMDNVYNSFEEAVDKEVISRLKQAKLSLLELDVQKMSHDLIKFSEDKAGYVFNNSKMFWEVIDEYAV